jgi:hypothetical protein
MCQILYKANILNTTLHYTEFYNKMKRAYDESQRGNTEYFEKVNFLLISALTLSIFYCMSKVQFTNDNIVE